MLREISALTGHRMPCSSPPAAECQQAPEIFLATPRSKLDSFISGPDLFPLEKMQRIAWLLWTIYAPFLAHRKDKLHRKTPKPVRSSEQHVPPVRMSIRPRDAESWDLEMTASST
jgi:hypothetical protein